MKGQVSKMGVLEDVVINAKSAAATVGKKAEYLVDISKLRLNAAEIQGEISKKYEELGRFVYDSVKADTSVKGLLEEHVEGIDALYQKLDDVNEKINSLRKKSPCPVCGTQNAEESMFCSHCGVKLKYNDATQKETDDGVSEAGAPADDAQVQ